MVQQLQKWQLSRVATKADTRSCQCISHIILTENNEEGYILDEVFNFDEETYVQLFRTYLGGGKQKLQFYTVPKIGCEAGDRYQCRFLHASILLVSHLLFLIALWFRFAINFKYLKPIFPHKLLLLSHSFRYMILFLNVQYYQSLLFMSLVLNH